MKKIDKALFFVMPVFGGFMLLTWLFDLRGLNLIILAAILLACHAGGWIDASLYHNEDK